MYGSLSRMLSRVACASLSGTRKQQRSANAGNQRARTQQQPFLFQPLQIGAVRVGMLEDFFQRLAIANDSERVHKIWRANQRARCRTVSMWAVCGNRSNKCACSTLKPDSSSKRKSRARVAGSHETYVTRGTDMRPSARAVFSPNPARGGSTMTKIRRELRAALGEESLGRGADGLYVGRCVVAEVGKGLRRCFDREHLIKAQRQCQREQPSTGI